MWKKFEYRVCTVQAVRVTFVDNVWQGTVAPAEGNHEAAFDSCPYAWDYLNEQGRYGWEIAGVAVHHIGEVRMENIYLKRETG
jgi:hypothetical protein